MSRFSSFSSFFMSFLGSSTAADNDSCGANARTNDSIKLLCIGDSLTAGYYFYGTEFSPYGKTVESLSQGKIEVDVIGMSGFTSAQLLGSMNKTKVYDVCHIQHCGIKKQLTKKQYDLVLLMIGTNDIGMRVELDELTENILLLKDVCLKHCPKLVLFTIPSSRPAHSIEIMNERIKDIVDKNGGVNTFLFDCHAFFLHHSQPQQNSNDSNNDSSNENNSNEGKKDVRMFDSDGLHFSEDGSRLLGEKIFSELERFGITIQVSEASEVKCSEASEA